MGRAATVCVLVCTCLSVAYFLNRGRANSEFSEGMSWLSNSWVLSDTNEGVEVTGIFLFRNTGHAPVTLYSCRCAAGCVLATGLPITIQPNQSKLLTVSTSMIQIGTSRSELDFMSDSLDRVSVVWELDPRKGSWYLRPAEPLQPSLDPMFSKDASSLK